MTRLQCDARAASRSASPLLMSGDHLLELRQVQDAVPVQVELGNHVGKLLVVPVLALRLAEVHLQLLRAEGSPPLEVELLERLGDTPGVLVDLGRQHGRHEEGVVNRAAAGAVQRPAEQPQLGEAPLRGGLGGCRQLLQGVVGDPRDLLHHAAHEADRVLHPGDARAAASLDMAVRRRRSGRRLRVGLGEGHAAAARGGDGP
mmetsp:Transcript_32020/g.84041  ORF Transcript_32020/g.84041 Transcript_32020/m.84041 type:complete len:202 (-) Transcript_32020:1693-2298(-)